MQSCETEPFPGVTEEQLEPFPEFDSRIVDNISDSSFQFLPAATEKHLLSPYRGPFVGRPPPARLSLSVTSPSHSQRAVFESFPQLGSQGSTLVHTAAPFYDSPPNLSDNERMYGKVAAELISRGNMSQVGTSLEKMQYAGAPYANFWHAKKTYKACVNDKDVTLDVFAEPVEEQEVESPEQRLGTVKERLSRLLSAFYRKQPSAVMGIQHMHDPRVIYEAAFGPHPALGPDRCVPRPKSMPKYDPRIVSIFATENAQKHIAKESTGFRSFSFKGVSQNISRRLAKPEPDYRPQMLGLADQAHPYPNLHSILPKDRVGSINNWVETLVADIPIDERQENFIALTTAELIAIGGADIDGIEIVKKYYAPQSTPAAGSYHIQEIKDIFDEDERHPRRKDLISYLGTRNSGFHLVSMMDISGSTFEDPINLSDYYGVPLIEPDKGFRIPSTPVDFNIDGSSEAGDFDYDTTQNNFKAPRRFLPPAHSLILYLVGKTLNITTIVSLLSYVDRDWLFRHQGRWYKGLRVPELPDFSDEMVNKITSTYRREIEYWEMNGATDERGLVYPEASKFLKKMKRETEIRKLVEKVVENHFWWRCRNREVLHLDLCA